MVRTRKPDDMMIRFPEGTRQTIETVLVNRERPADFIRLAVAALLLKRSAPGRRKELRHQSPG